jgi:tetratricopeptide (TPR) repeat protein
VLALARPEVDRVFPRLWAGRALQTLHLAELPRRSAERLVKQGLGDAATPEQVKALVQQGGGNAFYLEELIRAVATGRGADLPETVLAMAQARLEGLDAESRRVLRAASIFGSTFTQEGVEALLGGASVAHQLDALVAGEVLTRRGAEHGFRHALVREAAYGMLTEADRAVGHALAGAFVEREGGGDAMALAEHFERGRDPARAAASYLRAAALALEGDDLTAALDRAAKVEALGARGAELGTACLIAAEAHQWRGEFGQAEDRANAAAALLTRGGIDWFRARNLAAVASSRLGALDRAEAAAADSLSAEALPDARSERICCLCACATGLLLEGRYAVADALFERLDAEIGDPPALDDAPALGALHEARAIRVLRAGDLGAGQGGLQAALEAFTRAGDRRNACSTWSNLAHVFTELGDLVGAEAALLSARAAAEQMGLHEVAANMLNNLGHTVARAGRVDEARALLGRALEAHRAHGNVRQEGVSRTYLAHAALLSSDAEAAERHAREATERFRDMPPARAQAIAVLARALVREGRTGEALEHAEEAAALLEAAGGAIEEGEALVRLAHVEALTAAGRTADAARALAAARERLRARAALIRDDAVRARFLTQVPENAALLGAPTEHEA